VSDPNTAAIGILIKITVWQETKTANQSPLVWYKHKRHKKQVEVLTFDFKIAENTVFDR
jgi:hypothetical protein